MNENKNPFGVSVRELAHELVDFLNKNQISCEGYSKGNIQLNALINVLSQILYVNSIHREKAIEAIADQIRIFFAETDNRGGTEKNIEIFYKG